jgi:hypothetical protein
LVAASISAHEERNPAGHVFRRGCCIQNSANVFRFAFRGSQHSGVAMALRSLAPPFSSILTEAEAPRASRSGLNHWHDTSRHDISFTN